MPAKTPTLLDPPTTKELKTASDEKPDALAVAPPTDIVSMLERVATNKDVDVEKLERLIQMQERILDRNAKGAFDSAFAAMQPEIPEIDERGAIKVGTDVRSKYALNEDIQKVLKPILAKHGFSLRFRVEWPTEKRVRVIGILAHRDGHAEQSEFLSEADSSGGKNAIQGLGSAISYGHRYTTCDLLNITSRGQDDDGRSAGLERKVPEGFVEWHEHMQAVAPKGWKAFQAAWEVSDQKFRKAILAHEFEAIKRVALDADKAAQQ